MYTNFCMETREKFQNIVKVQHNAAFHLGLHSLLWLKQPIGTESHHYLETSTSDPFEYKFGNVWENPSEYKG